MGSTAGALRSAATKTGLGVQDYLARMSAGEKWCTRCKTWQPISSFGLDRSRKDGFAATCTPCRVIRHASTYVRSTEPRPRGRRFVQPRHGDRRQARARVNYLITLGALTSPAEVACRDCGHLGADKRHEYDHHLGYDAENHERVEAVCTTCHHARERARAEVRPG